MTIFLAFSEPYGDSIMLAFKNIFSQGDIIIKKTIFFLFLFLFLTGIPSKLPRFQSIFFPFYCITIVMIWGFINGLIFNVSLNAFNDLSSFIPFILIMFKREDFKIINFTKLSKILIIILLFKYFLYQFFSVLLFGVPSWKILMKQSPILLICFSIFLHRISSFTKTKWDIFFLMISFFLILAAQARMLLGATIFVLIVSLFLGLKKSILLRSLPIFLLAGVLFMNFQGGTIEVVVDQYSGALYEYGLNYRMEQWIELKNRITESWFLGKGLGYFNPLYLTYGQLVKPYQLELDILNFISKVGIIFSFLYLVAYTILFWFLSLKKVYFSNNNLIPVFIGILGLLVYSLGQTFHQGYLFWFIFLLFYINLDKEWTILKYNDVK